ncbi:hypothetical protein N7481_011657 [Penicillium waksmanii]|uniref:uncharacterized protein n=1 Tax=Penicillium waksmanii TaxID=69791 RepID=UPI00254814D8|nr:uncharacterized protein N7481_011657 [Penicillium waksmanii]KAJ5974447.1 hypothetical protein N7481_011657 [Penicillium waksmanii]
MAQAEVLGQGNTKHSSINCRLLITANLCTTLDQKSNMRTIRGMSPFDELKAMAIDPIPAIVDLLLLFCLYDRGERMSAWAAVCDKDPQDFQCCGLAS